MSAHSKLVLLDFSSIDLRLKVLHLAVIVSLHVCKLLVLLVLKSKLLVAVLFDVISKHVLALSLLLKSLSKGLVDMNIRDVAVFKNDAENGELLIKVLNHGSGHVTFKVEHLGEPDAIDKVADTFINFSIEHFVEAASSKLVDEILYFLLSTRHTE